MCYSVDFKHLFNRLEDSRKRTSYDFLIGVFTQWTNGNQVIDFSDVATDDYLICCVVRFVRGFIFTLMLVHTA